MPDCTGPGGDGERPAVSCRAGARGDRAGDLAWCDPVTQGQTQTRLTGSAQVSYTGLTRSLPPQNSRYPRASSSSQSGKWLPEVPDVLTFHTQILFNAGFL